METLEDDGFIAIRFDPAFPFEDVETIGARLTDSGALVAGYAPSDLGMLSMPALRIAQSLDGTETRFLVDRNLISRMARIARDGVPAERDKPTALAIDLMAFAQAMDLQIDPSFAFHELAHCEGNDIALDELAWFRAADEGQAMAWIDMAQGRIGRLPISRPFPQPFVDLALPLRRWRRN